MAKFSVNTHRHDPYKTFKFRVIWDGSVIAGISGIGGLHRITEVIDYRDGGDSSQMRTSPGLTRFEPIVLERGLTHDRAFEDWANLVFSIQGDAGTSLKNYRKDIIIQLLNLQGSVVKSYHIYRCWVSEYLPISTLDATGNEPALERLVLQHEGWERDEAVGEPAEF
ncbi:MAG: phage tail protein [Cyclobacteriaceae bacterium]|nr:phage tail protein [Cyclobacteriaceae bacterium]